jgi:hypothetical protein
MPFIKPERRPIIDEKGLWALDEIQVGDYCYEFYKPMVDRWRANPRWTTAHEIYRDMIRSVNKDWDMQAAYELAWQVFFIKYVWPYEQKKIEENGDI